MFQYGDKRPVFDVLSPEGTDLSPALSAIYLFLTMIIVFQVWNQSQITRTNDVKMLLTKKPYMNIIMYDLHRHSFFTTIDLVRTPAL